MRAARCQSVGSPRRRLRVGRDDEQLDVAANASAEIAHVCRPGEPLVIVGRELDLDDDAEHGFAIDQEHDEVGVASGGHDVRKLRALDAGFGVRRQLDAQRITQELSGELGAIAEEQEQRFMEERRHR